MTPDQIELARHALGLPNREKRSYRNRFVAGEGHADFRAWEGMVAAGDAEKRKWSALPPTEFLYRMTPQGASKALQKGERLCPEDFPS